MDLVLDGHVSVSVSVWVYATSWQGKSVPLHGHAARWTHGARQPSARPKTVVVAVGHRPYMTKRRYGTDSFLNRLASHR